MKCAHRPNLGKSLEKESLEKMFYILDRYNQEHIEPDANYSVYFR